MNTSASTKTVRAKSRRNTGRFPQGFVPELNEPDATDAASVVENKPPGQHGAALFQLEAPMADTVKLVADFTGWEKRPLDLVRAEDGAWRLTVALPPGRYAYRFLVDGEWCDDPRCARREPNPFGTHNAVIEVG